MKTTIKRKGIKGGKGGMIYPIQKGEVRNRTGQPKQPRKLKEFIKELETEDDELMFPEEAVEIVTKDGKTFYKLRNSKGGKMFMTAYNRAIKGDARWADFLVKMGFAGGYEPTKTDNKTEISGQLATNQISIEIIKNYNENKNQSDTETNAGVGSTD